MKVIHIYGGTLSSSRVKRIGGIEEHFLNLKSKLKENFFIVYAGTSRDTSFEKNMGESMVVLTDKSYFYYMIEYIKFIKKQKNEDAQLIVHVHFSPISHLVIVATRLLGIRRIYWTKHSRLMIKRFSKSWFINKISTFFVKKVICVSQAIEAELGELSIGKDKTEVVPLGLNIKKYQKTVLKSTEELLRKELKINSTDFVITIVAQQRPEKRVEVFIEAFAEFIKKTNSENIVGLVVGGGPLEEKNIELAKKLEIFDKLRFLGLRHDIDVIYKISDIAGLTSETEGLPFALMEACSLALPLFGSVAGGIPEIIKNEYNGLLFEVGDYKALAKIFDVFYNDALAREKLGNNSYQHISVHYEINKCTDRLISLYKNEFGL